MVLMVRSRRPAIALFAILFTVACAAPQRAPRDTQRSAAQSEAEALLTTTLYAIDLDDGSGRFAGSRCRAYAVISLELKIQSASLRFTTKDPWGHSYRIDGSLDNVVRVSSDGPNGIARDEDDIIAARSNPLHGYSVVEAQKHLPVAKYAWKPYCTDPEHTDSKPAAASEKQSEPRGESILPSFSSAQGAD